MVCKITPHGRPTCPRLPTMAHGSTRKNERIPNAGGLCIAAGSSGPARAQAMLTGEMYRTHALSPTTERRAWRDARCGLCARFVRASFVKNRKELITDHLTNVQSGRPVRARSHCAGSTHTAGGRAEPPWLQCISADRACVRAVCVCRPQGQSPDLTCTRGAALAECALIARADLSGLALEIA